MLKVIAKDKPIRNFMIIALLFFLVATLTIFVQVGNEEITGWISNLAGIIPATMCFIMSTILWMRYPSEQANKRIWGWFAFGFLSWAIGEWVWFYFDVLQGITVPYPSLGDYAWVLGYVGFFMGIYLLYRSFGIHAETRQNLLVSGVLLLLLALSFVFVIWPIVSYADYGAPIEQFLSAAYPIGDLLVAMGFSLIVLLLWGGELSSVWIIFSSGMLLIAFSDSLFSYADWNEIYYPGGAMNFVSMLVDITYYASYIIMATGIYIHGRLTQLF